MNDDEDFEYKHSLRKVLFWGIVFGLIVIAILSGCQSYQPPGENLWLAL